MTRVKREQVGADTFVAAGLAEGDGFDQLQREEIAYHLERHGDEFLIRWPAHRVECAVTSLREHSEGITGELAVSHGGVELHWGRLGFASTQTREGVVRKLSGILPEVPWRTIIEVACRATVRALRESSTTVPLLGRRAGHLRFLVDPLLPLGQVAVIFGDGGVGKGHLAVAVARAVAHAAPLPSGLFAPLPGPVLYLDWESDQEDLDDRVALQDGGLGGGLGLHYRRMHRPLADEAPALRADVSRLGITFVVVDSLAPAAGPEPEGADAALRTHNAIRGLGSITCLCLAHVSKAGADQRGPARPFGSVFVQNMARSVWEMRRSEDQEGDELRVALYHRKANRTRLRPPLGFRFQFTDDRITVQNADLAEAPDLLARASTSTQVLAALRPGAKSITDLAKELGLNPETVRKTLQRLLQRDRVVRLSDLHGGKGQEIPWGLRG
jgi:hypothetical protein